jgi:predicted transport protein
MEECSMNKFGLYSEGPKISLEDHLSRLDEPAKTIFQEIRNFALSLGSNVIEEVRPHRIVYAKSFNFRTFLDIEPAVNVLTVSVKTGPRGESTKLTISSKEQMPHLKELLKQAYTTV